MAQKHSHDENRRDPRYQALSSCVQCVNIERLGKESGEIVEGKLLDLSKGGVKLLVTSAVKFSESLGLHFSIPELDVELEVTACVCWSQPVDSSNWLLGCSFLPRISDEVLGKLATRGLIERRQSPREPIDVSGTLDWQLLEQPTPVRVRGISRGGFDLESKFEVPVAQTVILRLFNAEGSGVDITADTQWILGNDGVFSVGCAFKSSRDYQMFRELIPSKLRVEQKKEAHSTNWTTTCLQLLCVFGIFGIAEYSIFRRHLQDTQLAPVFVEPVANLSPVTTLAGLKSAVDNTLLEVDGPNSDDVDGNAPDDPPDVPDSFDAPAVEKEPAVEDDVRTKASRQETAQSATAQHVVVPEMIETTPVDKTAAVDPNDMILAMEWNPIAIAAQNTISLDEINDVAAHDAINAIVPAAESEESTEKTDSTGLETEPVVTDELTTDQPVDDTQDQLEVAGKVELSEENSSQADKGSDVESIRLIDESESKQPPPQVDIQKAIRDYVDGDQKYRRGRFADAAQAFQSAVRNDSENPLYRYLLAMAQYRMGQSDEATDTLQTAVRLESKRPIKNWGRALSRYQGAVRLWVESHRSRTKSLN